METTKVALQGPAVGIAQSNNQWKPTLYLAGPINGRSDADAMNWREWVKAQWPGLWMDPMARDYRGREMEPGIAELIVNGDLLDIQQSDAMLVMFDKPSVGTAMEVFYCATVLHKPVFVIDAQPYTQIIERNPLSPWLVHHSSAIYQRLDEETLVSIWNKINRA